MFSQFREMTDPIASFLSGNIRALSLVLHGGVAVSRRDYSRDIPASRRPALCGSLLESRRHRAQFHSRVACGSFRSLVEPGCGESRNRSGLSYRPASQCTGSQIRLPRHDRGEDRCLDRGEDGACRRHSRRCAESMLTEMSDRELLEIVSLDLERVYRRSMMGWGWGGFRPYVSVAQRREQARHKIDGPR